MNVFVDMTKCSGHARCFSANPDLFQLDDVGYAARESFDVTPGLESDAREGAAACPERAIRIAE